MRRKQWDGCKTEVEVYPNLILFACSNLVFEPFCYQKLGLNTAPIVCVLKKCFIFDYIE